MVFLEKNSGFFLHERNNLVIFEVVMTTIVNRVRFIFLILYIAASRRNR